MSCSFVSRLIFLYSTACRVARVLDYYTSRNLIRFCSARKNKKWMDRRKTWYTSHIYEHTHRSHCNVFLFIYFMFRFHPRTNGCSRTNIQFTRRAHIICMCKIITKQREERKIQVTHELCIIQSTNKTRTYICETHRTSLLQTSPNSNVWYIIVVA